MDWIVCACFTIAPARSVLLLSLVTTTDATSLAGTGALAWAVPRGAEHSVGGAPNALLGVS